MRQIEKAAQYRLASIAANMLCRDAAQRFDMARRVASPYHIDGAPVGLAVGIVILSKINYRPRGMLIWRELSLAR